MAGVVSWLLRTGTALSFRYIRNASDHFDLLRQYGL